MNTQKIKNVQESHNPLKDNHYISIQHIERYKFAITKLPPDAKILDIASGFGYGTMMLKQAGKDVYGVDKDKNTINKAKNVWQYKKFFFGDANNLPFKDNYFDALVSFETIEHVNSGVTFLKEMKRVLKPGGIFICSTPNIKYTAHPQCHKIEYSPENFFKLLSQKFDEVNKYAQYFKLKNRISDIIYFKLKKIANNNDQGYLLKIYREIKKIFKKNIPSQNLLDNQLIKQINNIVNENNNSYYKVKKYKGNSFLRIMVVVAKNK